MSRHLITFAFLALAISLYAAGAAGPGMVFLLLGGVAEIIFWLRLLGRDGHRQKD